MLCALPQPTAGSHVDSVLKVAAVVKCEIVQCKSIGSADVVGQWRLPCTAGHHSKPWRVFMFQHFARGRPRATLPCADFGEYECDTRADLVVLDGSGKR